MQMRLRLEGPDIDDGFRRPLTDGFEGFAFAPHVPGVGLVDLAGVVEGSVAVSGLVGVFFEQTRGFRLRTVAPGLPQTRSADTHLDWWTGFIAGLMGDKACKERDARRGGWLG